MNQTLLKYRMKYEPGETMESWAERVRKYEYGYALQQIAKGENVDLVLEAMAARIIQKLMHPIMTELGKSVKENYSYNSEESKSSYFEKMQFRKPASDHVDEND